MEGTEDTRDEVAAADTVVADEGNTGTEEKRKSTGSRRSGAPSPKPEPVEDAADDAAEDEDKDVEEEEVKLVPKSKSKDSMKREEIEMNDHAVAPPVAAASAEGTTENNDVEQGKQNGLNHPDKTDSEKKSMLQLMKKREIIICFIGGITFLIGLIMIIVGLMVMQSRCDRQLLGSEMATNGHSNGNTGSVADPQVSHNRHSHNHDHHDVEVPYVLHGSNRSEESHHHGNLAKDKPAFLSSTWMAADGSPLNASLAVDGLHSNKANKGHCAQTESQSRPYWYVDLEQMHAVKRVKIVIPGDCCIGELHDFEVRVGPNVDLELNNLCKHFMGTALKVSINIECDMELYGRYVSIQMLGDDVRPRDRLTLCEVMVYSK